MIALVQAHPRHVATIAKRMRAADVEECAWFGHTPREALRLGLASSQWAVTALVDGRPEAMLGVVAASVIESMGRPWMLGTDVVARHGCTLVKTGRDLVAAMLRGFRRLENEVGADNRAAVLWLERMGFTVEAGWPMRRFWMERS